jgi:AraC-like DNA-binding protein
VNNNTIQILLILILFLLGMLGLFLITHPRGNRRSNTLLGALLLAWMLVLADSLGILTGWTAGHSRLAFWGNQLFWLIGPFLFLYTRSVLDPQFRLRPRHLWHVLPLLLMLLPTQLAWQTLPEEIRVEALQNAFSMRDGWLGLLLMAPYVQFGVYLLASFRELKRYRGQLANNYSREDQVQLPWLQFFLWGILVVVMLGVLQNLIRFLTSSALFYELSILAGGIALLTFFGLFIFKALRQPEIFSGLPALTSPPPEQQLNDQEKQALTILADRLQTYTQTQQPYLKPDLSLKELAAQLSVSPRELSQAINRILGQNFFDFVNQHRIELAQRKIAESNDPKVTVLEIMYEVGFQSKSSFNTAFKKFTGMTPTQWKTHVKAEDSGTQPLNEDNRGDS